MVFEHPVWRPFGMTTASNISSTASLLFLPRSREAFRDLRIGLSLAGGEDMKTIVVSSAVPDEGQIDRRTQPGARSS